MDTSTKLSTTTQSFLSYCRFSRRLAKDTMRAYENDMQQFLLHLSGQFPLISSPEQIHKTELLEYIAYMNQTYAVKTVKRKCATLRAYFNYLEEEEDLEKNPFNKIRVRIREPQKLPPVMSLQDIRNILNAVYTESFGVNWCGDPEISHLIHLRNIAVLELLFATGLRVQELCNLKYKDYNRVDHSLMIWGKGSKERKIHIGNSEVLNALDRYLECCRQCGIDNTYLFISRFKKKMSTQAVRNMVTKYAELAGVFVKITPHTFRHTFATLLLEEGVDIKYIQEFLGHSSINTTQIYLHVPGSAARKVLTTMHPRGKLTVNIQSQTDGVVEKETIKLIN